MEVCPKVLIFVDNCGEQWGQVARLVDKWQNGDVPENPLPPARRYSGLLLRWRTR